MSRDEDVTSPPINGQISQPKALVAATHTAGRYWGATWNRQCQVPPKIQKVRLLDFFSGKKKTISQDFEANSDTDSLESSQNTAAAPNDKSIVQTLNALNDISESRSNPTHVSHHNTNLSSTHAEFRGSVCLTCLVKSRATTWNFRYLCIQWSPKPLQIAAVVFRHQVSRINVWTNTKKLKVKSNN